MITILRTPEGKKVVINPREDERLYDAPRNPPNTGTAYTSGTDLYRHVARSGNAYYYTYSWSMWQGSEASYELIDEDEVKEFLLDKAQCTGVGRISGAEWNRAEELFPGLFSEDA